MENLNIDSISSDESSSESSPKIIVKNKRRQNKRKNKKSKNIKIDTDLPILVFEKSAKKINLKGKTVARLDIGENRISKFPEAVDTLIVDNNNRQIRKICKGIMPRHLVVRQSNLLHYSSVRLDKLVINRGEIENCSRNIVRELCIVGGTREDVKTIRKNGWYLCTSKIILVGKRNKTFKL